MSFLLYIPLADTQLLIGELSHYALNQLLASGKVVEAIRDGKIVYQVVNDCIYNSPFGHAKMVLVEGYYFVGEQ